MTRDWIPWIIVAVIGIAAAAGIIWLINSPLQPYDEARRIAANIAKLPELLTEVSGASIGAGPAPQMP